jgi:hypothetical protein
MCVFYSRVPLKMKSNPVNLAVKYVIVMEKAFNFIYFLFIFDLLKINIV